MCAFLCFLSVVDWVAIASLAVAIAAFVVAKRTLHVARETIRIAEDDWRQRKWFDLYFAANQAYDLLDRYQVVHAGQHTPQTHPHVNDWNELMFKIRHVHSMALVFPKNAVVDRLIDSTALFDNPVNAFDAHRLPEMFEAIEGLRGKARIKSSILD